jgi:hypothetical protein
MLNSLNRPRAIPALFTTAGLSLQFFRENAFVATLDDNDKDSLLSGLNIRKKESSVKGKDVKEKDHKIWAPFLSRPGRASLIESFPSGVRATPNRASYLKGCLLRFKLLESTRI